MMTSRRDDRDDDAYRSSDFLGDDDEDVAPKRRRRRTPIASPFESSSEDANSDGLTGVRSHRQQRISNNSRRRNENGNSSPSSGSSGRNGKTPSAGAGGGGGRDGPRRASRNGGGKKRSIGDSTPAASARRRRRGRAPGGSSSSPPMLDARKVKEAVDIVDVIEKYDLDRFERTRTHGTRDSAVALCPFHDDHNPSLRVDGGRQIFKCFACGAGGDVFAFVRKYHDLTTGDDEGGGMTFYQAVKHVRDAFVNGEGDGSLMLSPSRASRSSSSSSSTPQHPSAATVDDGVAEEVKERLYLANAAAAAFYADCLLEPSAGKARSYLSQERCFSPQTVRTFALGYAPDAYYGSIKTNTTTGSAMGTQASSSSWGVGSLAEHLIKDLGFTPKELLDAGLAKRTNTKVHNYQNRGGVGAAVVNGGSDNGRRQRVASSRSVNNTAAPEEVARGEESIDYSSLMDRFRDRLVIPILDSTGKNVLGFGGRRIPSNDGKFTQVEVADEFEGPKYLNSPESAVFHKQDLLFGENQARESIQNGKARVESSSPIPLAGASIYADTIIVVEGYMDAIALWSAGFKSVVATMGTALSKQQLHSAAKASGSGGRVVLCLDNDEAGTAAVERICSNGMLREMSESNSVEILVASLPDGVKDPDEFIQAAAAGNDRTGIAEKFQKTVVDRAIDWIMWYVDRIVSGYVPKTARGQPGSFSVTFERIAEFLAKSLNVADRAKTAYEVAGKLAGLLATESNATDISDALRSQLESDLLDRTSRIASSKYAIQRRVESVIGDSKGVQSALTALSRGEGLSGAEDEEKLSRAALKRERGVHDVPGASSGKFTTRLPGKRRTMKARRFRRNDKEKQLTPHFRGFQFAHKSDSDWLELSESPLVLGEVEDRGGRMAAARFRRRRQSDLVYFGSNRYNGYQFLTEDAENAGYTRGVVKLDPSLLKNGVSSLVKPDIDQLALSAEYALLKTLVRNKFARTALKNMVEARMSVGSSVVDIEWSCREKGWLLSCLIKDTAAIPDSPFESTEELHPFLTSLWDESETNREENGRETTNSSVGEGWNWAILEPFFVEEATRDGEDGEVPQANDQIRCELAVQQNYVTLLWATTVRHAYRLEEKLTTVWRDLELLKENGENRTSLQLPPGTPDVAGNAEEENQHQLRVKLLGEERSRLLSELSETIHAMQSLVGSSRRLTSRLVDATSTNGIEGRLCPRFREDLIAQVDDFVSNLEEGAGGYDADADGEGGSAREDDEEAHERFLDRLRRDWGPLFDDDDDDDGSWSDGDFDTAAAATRGAGIAAGNGAAAYNYPPDEGEEDGEEDVQEFLRRLDEEWKGWEEKVNNQTLVGSS